jgi:Rps23 Pro-64 3,4-dihydroxylase Tpa1-like proline 4-hydroxylase
MTDFIAKKLNWNSINDQIELYGHMPPFDHVVIDNFFEKEFANQLANEFPAVESEIWHGYNNPLEIKLTNNVWNNFGEETYKIFSYLNSDAFIQYLSEKCLNNADLFSDPGLNGGGWHVHGSGGKLNTHLDYSMHPKLKMQRKLNLIIYLNQNWQKQWGGSLGFWDNQTANEPGSLQKQITCKFNRAVIFDTTQNSWHGLPEPIQAPTGELRKSIAAYYLVAATADVDTRGKALYAPTKDQENDAEILSLIKKRSNVTTAHSTYKKEDS